MSDAHLAKTSMNTNATLLQSGENLALLNPELFLENARLRSKLRGNPETTVKKVFRRFPKFPREIRDMIYTEAALDVDARVIEVMYRPNVKLNKLPSQSLVPALLHACTESREAAKKVYSEFPKSGNVRICKDTFINWEKDIVFFKDAATFGLFARPTFKAFKPHCRNIAIMWSDQEFLTVAGWRGLENIERLFLVRWFEDRTQEQSGQLLVKEVSDGFNPDSNMSIYRQPSASSAAESFLARSRRNTLALKECIAVDLVRDGNFKRKIYSKKAEEERKRRLERTEVHEQFAQDALLAAQTQEDDRNTHEDPMTIPDTINSHTSLTKAMEEGENEQARADEEELISNEFSFDHDPTFQDSFFLDEDEDDCHFNDFDDEDNEVDEEEENEDE